MDLRKEDPCIDFLPDLALGKFNRDQIHEWLIGIIQPVLFTHPADKNDYLLHMIQQIEIAIDHQLLMDLQQEQSSTIQIMNITTTAATNTTTNHHNHHSISSSGESTRFQTKEERMQSILSEGNKKKKDHESAGKILAKLNIMKVLRGIMTHETNLGNQNNNNNNNNNNRVSKPSTSLSSSFSSSSSTTISSRSTSSSSTATTTPAATANHSPLFTSEQLQFGGQLFRDAITRRSQYDIRQLEILKAKKAEEARLAIERGVSPLTSTTVQNNSSTNNNNSNNNSNNSNNRNTNSNSNQQSKLRKYDQLSGSIETFTNSQETDINVPPLKQAKVRHEINQNMNNQMMMVIDYSSVNIKEEPTTTTDFDLEDLFGGPIEVVNKPISLSTTTTNNNNNNGHHHQQSQTSESTVMMKSSPLGNNNKSLIQSSPNMKIEKIDISSTIDMNTSTISTTLSQTSQQLGIDMDQNITTTTVQKSKKKITKTPKIIIKGSSTNNS
jgi:hypothetical protein